MVPPPASLSARRHPLVTLPSRTERLEPPPRSRWSGKPPWTDYEVLFGNDAPFVETRPTPGQIAYLAAHPQHESTKAGIHIGVSMHTPSPLCDDAFSSRYDFASTFVHVDVAADGAPPVVPLGAIPRSSRDGPAQTWRACSEEANSVVRGGPPEAAHHARPACRGRCVGSPFLLTTRPRSLLRGELGRATGGHVNEAGYIRRAGAARSGDTHMHVR